MVCAVAGTASYQRLSPVSQRGPPACPPEPPLPRLAVPPVHARPVRLRDSGQRTDSSGSGGPHAGCSFFFLDVSLGKLRSLQCDEMLEGLKSWSGQLGDGNTVVLRRPVCRLACCPLPGPSLHLRPSSSRVLAWRARVACHVPSVGRGLRTGRERCCLGGAGRARARRAGRGARGARGGARGVQGEVLVEPTDRGSRGGSEAPACPRRPRVNRAAATRS